VFEVEAIGLEAVGDEEAPGPPEVPPRKEQVEVGELAEGHVAVCGRGKRRAFEGDCLNAVGVEQFKELQEFHGHEQAADGVVAPVVGEALQNGSWDGVGARGREAAIEERQHAVRAGELHETGPVEPLGGEGLYPRGRVGRELGSRAAEEEFRFGAVLACTFHRPRGS